MIVIAFYNLLLYAGFRGGVYSYLRLSKMSRSNIKKSRKGFINYWLYHSIHRQRSLGILYGLNLTFLIATVAFMLFAMTLGYIGVLQPILLAFSAVLCLIEVPSVIIASIHSTREEHGAPFVLLAKRKHSRGYDCTLIECLSWAMTAFLICLSYQQL